MSGQTLLHGPQVARPPSRAFSHRRTLTCGCRWCLSLGERASHDYLHSCACAEYMRVLTRAATGTHAAPYTQECTCVWYAALVTTSIWCTLICSALHFNKRKNTFSSCGVRFSSHFCCVPIPSENDITSSTTTYILHDPCRRIQLGLHALNLSQKCR